MNGRKMNSNGSSLWYSLWFTAMIMITRSAYARTNEVVSPYWIVLDGGSTGSRLHIFEFADGKCRRRGSKKAWTPLSSFGHNNASNNSDVAQHLLPLFQYAAEIIPVQYYNSTVVKYQATAGMRLLDEYVQRQIYHQLYIGLRNDPSFVFHSLQPSDIGTLSGSQEGFYGAVAANYLQGLIDVHLHLQKPQHPPIGALDMGGSSTQIVFLPQSDENSCSFDENDDSNSGGGDDGLVCQEMDFPRRMQEEDFFAVSYLSFGVDQFRERLWDAWIHDEKRELNDNVIYNPCFFAGYEMEFKGFVLRGTGDAEECQDAILEQLHLPQGLPKIRGKFFGMSLYFFTLDCLRELSGDIDLHLAWPTPSIEELSQALSTFCGREWTGDLEDIQHTAHIHSRAEILPHRCFESVYLVTLLRDGYGFHPSSRDITFSFHVHQSEVEWSMGMALSLYSTHNTPANDTIDQTDLEKTLNDDNNIITPQTPTNSLNTLTTTTTSESL